MLELNANYFLINLKRLLFEGFFFTIPDAIIMACISFLIFGLKENLSIKRLFVYALFALSGYITARMFFEPEGLHILVYLLLNIVLFKYIFSINYRISIILNAVIVIFSAILQLIFFSLVSLILKLDVNSLINPISPFLFVLKFILYYIYFIITALILYMIHRKNFVLFDLKKFKLFYNTKFSNYKEEYVDNIKSLLLVLFPTSIFIILNFVLYYFQAFNCIEISSIPYLAINCIALIISNILMIYLVKKVTNLKHYKTEWKTQQKYLEDINNLLKRLREQKHGFINHMNIIYGYLTIKKYDEAKKYLENIQQVVATTNNVLTVQNPSLNALLNVKAKIAESKNIKFEVNVDDNLSQLNFKVFEMGEAIGNIIDNAIEATYEQEVENRHVKINIYSDKNYYVFDIQNSGKTIPQDILGKIFEEGFTTKNYEHGEHGLGLYISKKIIEYNNGKIEVESKDNWTSFKIFLPKVIKNEFRAS